MEAGQVRQSTYHPDADAERVGALLVRTYSGAWNDLNWLQPRWAYMHCHPLVRDIDLSTVGLWDSDGEVVAAVHPEHDAGTVYFQLDPGHSRLRPEMLRYAEANLSVGVDGGRALRIVINDADADLQHLVQERGYARGQSGEAVSCLDRAAFAPVPPLPAGFRLGTLAAGVEPVSLGRLLWRGFGHTGEPPPASDDDYMFMRSARTFQADLHVVAVAPDGELASYCGLWYEPVHAIAYLEPVVTDPGFRRMGLGRATVLEGLRRCAARGATRAYVGSAEPFYRTLGFRQHATSTVWGNVGPESRR